MTVISKAGFSIYELLLTIGGIFLVVVFSIVIYQLVQNHQQVKKLTTTVAMLSDAELRYSLNNNGKFIDDSSSISKSAIADLVNQGYLVANSANSPLSVKNSSYSNNISVHFNSQQTAVTLLAKAPSLKVCKLLNKQDKVDMSCNLISLIVTKSIGAD